MSKEKVLQLFKEYSEAKLNNNPLNPDFKKRVLILYDELSTWYDGTDTDKYLIDLLQCLSHIVYSDNTHIYIPNKYTNTTNDINIWYAKLYGTCSQTESSIFYKLFKNHGIYAINNIIATNNKQQCNIKIEFNTLQEMQKFIIEEKERIIPHKIKYNNSTLNYKHTNSPEILNCFFEFDITRNSTQYNIIETPSSWTLYYFTIGE